MVLGRGADMIVAAVLVVMLGNSCCRAGIDMLWLSKCQHSWPCSEFVNTPNIEQFISACGCGPRLNFHRAPLGISFFGWGQSLCEDSIPTFQSLQA